ncbi:uncharacterized protein PRCAT00000589001 [Priceomyces carsonii]|uniref:uncharacterized protein n=1 Tax=Priceomyces carsonii TaxID=28549 RepID=UPI002ED7D06D|nr:unnamed protein product [Priceomyces carsonii]
MNNTNIEQRNHTGKAYHGLATSKYSLISNQKVSYALRSSFGDNVVLSVENKFLRDSQELPPAIICSRERMRLCSREI